MILGLAFIASCADLGTAPDHGLLADHSNITDPMLRWQAYGLTDYTVLQTRTCFCAYGGRQFRITVRSGVIAGIVDPSTGSPLSSEEWGLFKAIDDLFTLIHSIDTAHVAVFRVSYDPRYGYPVMMYVDPSAQIADEEYGYQTTILQQE